MSNDVAPTMNQYWTLVDVSSGHDSRTYEHRMPHGVLVRVSRTSSWGVAETIVFVPNPPSTDPYR